VDWLDFSWMADLQGWLAVLTLTVLEIVLGIDNIIFISILTSDLPADQQPRARRIGLLLAMVTRILLLLSLSWLMQLTAPLFTVAGNDLSGRDLILLIGGLFLLGKSTVEIHKKVEGFDGIAHTTKIASFGAVLVQVALLDIVFSLDSVITAIGMADHVMVMIIAVVISVLFMLAFVGPVNAFVDRHPTIKILALSFLLLVGLALVGESLDLHIPKGYIYFAMAFSVGVELLNMRLRKKVGPDTGGSP
jgi:predicted tellurium resistance membrane protein TerC